MSEETTELDTRKKPRRHRTGYRKGAQFVVLLTLMLGLATSGGFLWFASQATDTTARRPVSRADGIVVFTGGKDRIAVAASLLARGKGRRLLISGVNPATSRRDLEGLSPEMEHLSRCCIDLGRQALDTIGNAHETAQWARDHGFRSLLVVTSAYHLPRSLTELSRTMPNAMLTGVPVVSARLGKPWWRDAMTARLLVSEYTKYLASLARLTILPATTLAGTEG